MKFDRRRLLRGLALAAWAAFLDYLWLTDEAARYVGSRTAWVIPFGGIVLTLAALGYLAGLRGSGPGEPPTRRDLAGVVALLAPVLLVVVIPAPSLGALAVAKKGGNRNLVATADSAKAAKEPLTVFDIAAAATSPEFAEARGVVPGRRVDLIGFVSARRGGGAFALARFSASCCAADAYPSTVDVAPPAGAEEAQVDQWVRAKGTVVQGKDGTFTVKATELAVVDEPSQLYLES